MECDDGGFGAMNLFSAIGLLLSIGLLAAPAHAEETSCGFDGVTVEGRPAEVEGSCVALARVLAAFDAMGFPIEPKFSLIFKERVFVEMIAQSPQPDDARELLQVSAFFDSRRKLIEITSFDSPYQQDRRPWGIDWGPEIAGSILHHELAHMATFAVLGEDYRRIGRAWLEFIAYSVEFEVMDTSLRARILARNPEAATFASVWEVNGFLHSVDPDGFGLRSHLMAEANGGLEFIRRVIAGEVPFSRTDVLWRR